MAGLRAISGSGRTIPLKVPVEPAVVADPPGGADWAPPTGITPGGLVSLERATTPPAASATTTTSVDPPAVSADLGSTFASHDPMSTSC